MESVKSINEEAIGYCAGCGSEMQQFFLPLCNYVNNFLERREIEDYEGKCRCRES